MVVLILMASSGLLATEGPAAGQQEGKSDDQKYAGVWAGSYTTENGATEKLSFTFSKDEKGQWGGAVRFTNQDGEQKAEFKSLQFADGKMKGKIELADGQIEATVEGQFQGDQLEGAYYLSAKGSTEIAEKGTWKVAKSPAPKTGQ
jgi:hypothetical protein